VGTECGDAEGGEDCKEYTGGILMPTSDQIEQQLRDGFPFASRWFFRCTEGHCYYLQGEGEDAIALHRYQQPESWGAKLEDGGCWILSASEGSTPEEAISNLQVAIAQVGVIAATTEDATKL
jgi:hypothetical protein